MQLTQDVVAEVNDEIEELGSRLKPKNNFYVLTRILLKKSHQLTLKTYFKEE